METGIDTLQSSDKINNFVVSTLPDETKAT